MLLKCVLLLLIINIIIINCEDHFALYSQGYGFYGNATTFIKTITSCAKTEFREATIIDLNPTSINWGVLISHYSNGVYRVNLNGNNQSQGCQNSDTIQLIRYYCFYIYIFN